MDYVFYERFKQLESDVAHLKQIIVDLVEGTEEVPDTTAKLPTEEEKQQETPIPEEPEEIEARNPLDKDDEDVF